MLVSIIHTIVVLSKCSSASFGKTIDFVTHILSRYPDLVLAPVWLCYIHDMKILCLSILVTVVKQGSDAVSFYMVAVRAIQILLRILILIMWRFGTYIIQLLLQLIWHFVIYNLISRCLVFHVCQIKFYSINCFWLLICQLTFENYISLT